MHAIVCRKAIFCIVILDRKNCFCATLLIRLINYSNRCAMVTIYIYEEHTAHVIQILTYSDVSDGKG
jgi:hypothetical protein